jgi:hypothetical protein
VVAPALSNGVGRLDDSGSVIPLAQDKADVVGAGTATRGLKPAPPASVASSGTAPSLKIESATALGLDDGGDVLQVTPTPNGVAATPVESVESTGAFVGGFAIPATGHVVMLPGALPEIGAPRLSWIAPRAPPALRTAGIGLTIVVGFTGAGVVLDETAVCAKLTPQPNNAKAAPIRNKRRMLSLLRVLGCCCTWLVPVIISG